MTEILTASGLSRWFGTAARRTTAVHRVSLSVQDGELVAVLGPSGSGKSTLLALCGGLDRADEGSVVVSGQDVASLSQPHRQAFLQRTVGWVFRRPRLLTYATAAENVALAAQIAGESYAEAARLAQTGLEAVELGEKGDSFPPELTADARQRVALARALVRAPALLIADELTAELGPHAARPILSLLREAADSGTAVLLATHDPSAAAVADRVLLMEHGALQDATPLR